MREKIIDAQTIKDTWNMFLTTGGNVEEHRKRNLFRRLPIGAIFAECSFP